MVRHGSSTYNGLLKKTHMLNYSRPIRGHRARFSCSDNDEPPFDVTQGGELVELRTRTTKTPRLTSEIFLGGVHSESVGAPLGSGSWL